MSTNETYPGAVPSMSVQDAALQHDEEAALLVDVRELGEFVELRAEGAVLMPLSELGARFTELPPERPLMLVCRSGARSGRAASFLLQQGFRDVRNVTGGMLAWKSAGLATKSGPLDPGEGDLQGAG